MAIAGKKFELDLEADNFAFDIGDEEPEQSSGYDAVKEIKEKDITAPPPPPKLKSKSGFPEHRAKKNNGSAFKQRQEQSRQNQNTSRPLVSHLAEPSDRAIVNHIGRKYGIDPEAKEKADISKENKERIANMSTEDIEQARAELMSNLDPAFVQRLLRRANIEEDEHAQDWEHQKPSEMVSSTEGDAFKEQKQGFEQSESQISITNLRENVQEAGTDIPPTNNVNTQTTRSTTHFPLPPRDPSSYTSLDPDSASFLTDLKDHYFPSTPHDPSTLSWLKDPTEDEKSSSAYAPTQTSYAPSDIRFDFAGRLIPPSESSEIPVDKGLHHHGEAPESAGYTIPELSLLARSTLPGQRCIAYRTLGRVLYRLGRGDFGPKGTELNEGLWGCIEHERPVERMMSEANRTGGHVSAKAYATEGLWLWRKGGGGERGVMKPSERLAK